MHGVTLGFATEDASAFGIAVTGLYGLAAGLCGIAARRLRGRFWAGMAVALLSAGLNKQLNVQTDLLATGRALALRQGWYAWRRLVEAATLSAVAVVLLLLVVLAVRAGAGQAGGRTTLFGGCLLVLYVGLRATDILYRLAPGAPPAALLEPAGLGLILYGVTRSISRASPASGTGGSVNGRSARPDRS